MTTVYGGAADRSGRTYSALMRIYGTCAQAGAGSSKSAERKLFFMTQITMARQIATVPDAVVLPVGWSNVATNGDYVAPMCAALDLLRGAAARYDAGTKKLTIGGRVLIGYAGKVFAFNAQSSADYWIAIARQRALREIELYAAMPVGCRSAFAAGKKSALEILAARLVKAAEKISDARRGALLAESDFCLIKWGE